MLAKALALLIPLLAPTVLFFSVLYLRRLLFGAEPPKNTPWFWLALTGMLLVGAAFGWQWAQGVGDLRDDQRYVPAQMAPDGSIVPPTTAPKAE